jgi:hypothetical protein
MKDRNESRRLPSPAIVVALIALIAALTGSAIALPGKGSVDKGDLAKGSVTKKAIKNGAVTGKAIKAGAVTEAALADNAVTTAKIADNAVTDAKVDGVVPAAFAYINDPAAIVPAQSEGVGSATVSEENSFVCFNGLPFTPRNIQVTVARPGGGSEDAQATAFAPGDNNFCAGNEQASVQFVNENGTPVSPPRFYITFFD